MKTQNETNNELLIQIGRLKVENAELRRQTQVIDKRITGLIKEIEENT